MSPWPKVGQGRDVGGGARRWLGAAAIATLLAGCVSPSIRDPARTGPFFVPANHVGAADLTGVQRVILLPAWTGTVAARETAADIDRVLAMALSRQNRFEVITLSREECRARFQAEALASSTALPAGLLGRLRREFAADAVLFVDLTIFSAYPPLAIGFRAKLASVEESRLIWAFDEVFSSDDPRVANSVRHEALGLDHGGMPGDSAVSALQSPSRFGAYAAGAMFATLPAVRRPSVLAPPAAPAVPAKRARGA